MPKMTQIWFILAVVMQSSLSQYVNITCQDSPLNTYPYCNSNLPIPERVDDLLSRLTLWEKVYLQNSDQGGVPRLGVPTLGHSECNRGTGVSTSNLPLCAENVTVPDDFPLTLFPQAINLAGAFSRDIMSRMARAISNEVRAKFNTALKYGCNNDNGFGIACWAPMINICRDPRWGRCQEGYGEDPVLMSELVAHYIPRLQHDPNVPQYFQALSTCKHFDAFSGPKNMGTYDSIVNYRDWVTTYLPAFKTCNDVGTSSFMCSYNEINGIPACANQELLTQILREEWGFEGYVTSDCGAVPGVMGHGDARDHIEAAQQAIKAGCDWVGSCGGPTPAHLYLDLYYGVVNGTIPIQYLDQALRRVLPFWFKLGLIDHPITNPWSDLVLRDLYDKHQALAFEIAVKSMILFKNTDDYLPLHFDQLKGKTIAVIGPCADNDVCYSGDYAAVPLSFVSPLDALQSNYGEDVNIIYARGCTDPACNVTWDWDGVRDAVKQSDLVVYVGGISYQEEAEGHDRDSIELPPVQSQLFETVYDASNNGAIPIVSVLCYGAPVIDHVLFTKSIAILGAGYGGEMIGDAVVALMNGSHVPSGRSTVTWYESTDQLLDIGNYNMMQAPGRTYKYFTSRPAFPYGFGLSYTEFKYSALRVSKETIAPCQTVVVQVDVMNTGQYVADESVLLYLSVLNKTYAVDNLRMVNFTRIQSIAKGDTITVSLQIKPRWMTVVGDYYFDELIIPGTYQVMVGNNLMFNENTKTFEAELKRNFTVVGDATNIKECGSKID